MLLKISFAVKSVAPTALLVALAVCLGAPARAEISQPDAYQQLTDVPGMAPGHAPKTVNGLAVLSADEHRHHERLPMQLDGAIKKVKKKKYQPPGALSGCPH